MTTERARSFGSVAAAYERYRPEYPESLVRLVREYAARPIRSALELGAGTGKATRVFVQQGIPVMATDPDAAMLTELRRAVPGVQTIAATLEELPHIGPFDLVLVAAALHWTEPEGRWDRIAELLVPGGVFASFGGAPYLADSALDDAVKAAQRPWLVDESPPGPTTVSNGMHWPATELMADVRFTGVREVMIERRLQLPADDWVGYLSTVSAYLVLGEMDRAAALDAIAKTLPEVVEVTADLTLHLARRV